MYDFFVASSMVIVELPAIAMRIAPFQNRLTKKQKILLTVLYATILLGNFCICYYASIKGLIDVQFYKLKLIICGAFLLIPNLVILPKYFLEQIFTCGVEATLSTIIPVMVAFAAAFLPPFEGNVAIALNALAYTLIYSFIYPYLSKLLTVCVEPFLDLKTERYWGTICLIPMALFIGNFLTFPDTSYITSPVQFLGQLMIIFAVILVCLSVAKDPARMKAQSAMSRTMEIQKQYFTTITTQIQRVRRELHDAKYRVAAIERFIEMDDKDGLAEYCKTMIPKRYYTVEMFHSGNAAVDGILFHYSQRAESANIKFKIAGTVGKTDIPDDELCVLLGNAMENAFAGCMTLESDRFVTFVAQSEPQVLALMVQNSFDGKVKVKKGKLYSTKRKEGVGIGLNSMQMICKKYNGTMETQWDDHSFTVMMLLPIRAEEEDETASAMMF